MKYTKISTNYTINKVNSYNYIRFTHKNKKAYYNKIQ